MKISVQFYTFTEENKKRNSKASVTRNQYHNLLTTTTPSYQSNGKIKNRKKGKNIFPRRVQIAIIKENIKS